jgi:CDP-glucose 4,6-dehydratase
MDAAFWRGRRVLVTGHTGFKGSWLAVWLRRLEADVCGFALPPPTDPSLFVAAAVADGITSVTGDVRGPQHLSRVIEEHGSEIVFHLAAQSLVRDSYRDPVETYATNVMGTVHALEAVRRAGTVKAALIVTSDKCYQNPDVDRAFREGDPLGGRDPYSSSKACAELVVQAYRDSFFARPGERPRVASLRAGNIIGGGDWAKDRLVPDAVRAFQGGRPLLVRSPRSVRAWYHVLDALGGYLLLAERLWREDGHAAAWNFGPADEGTRPVDFVADRLAALWGDGASWGADEGAHPPEAARLRLDSGKARALLGWAPKLDLDRALEWTVEWYRSCNAGADARRLAESQLDRYAELEPAG